MAEDPSAEVADLRRQVSELQGILAIQRLKARYGELVDRRFSKGQLVDAGTLARVADEIAQLFTEDGEWDGGRVLGRVVGREAIAARLRRPTVSFARHFFLNPRISIDERGATATARWDVLSPCRTTDGTSYWMTGYEDDDYALVDGTWLLRRMRLTTLSMDRVAEGDLADRMALRDLVERYAQAVDRRDIDTVVSLFTEDGVLLTHLTPETEETPLVRRGHEELRRGLGLGLAVYSSTTHLIGSQVIDHLAGDDAAGTTACLGHHVSAGDDGGERLMVLAIRYEDRYRRERGGWRFAERRLRLQWSDVRSLAARS